MNAVLNYQVKIYQFLKLNYVFNKILSANLEFFMNKYTIFICWMLK
jgi:hypothetical protein